MSEMIEEIELNEDGRPLSANAIQQRRRETRAAERQERIENDERLPLLVAAMRHAMGFSLREIGDWLQVRRDALTDRNDSRLERELALLMDHPMGVALTAIRNGASPIARAA